MKPVVDAVTDIAAKRGLPQAQIALAWLLHQPGVTAPIAALQAPYRPLPPIGVETRAAAAARRS